MKIYKVKESAAVDKKLRGGGDDWTLDKKNKVLKRISNRYNAINRLLQMIPNLPSYNDEAYFFIKYEEVVPKTKRVLFRKEVKNVSEIPQIGARLDSTDKFKIYYKIKKKELKDFENELKSLLKNLDELTEKDLIFFTKIELISEISYDIFNIKFEKNIAVKILPIDSIIKILKEEQLVSFIDENTLLATVNFDQLTKIQARFPGVVYHIEEVKPLTVEVANLESFDEKLILKGPERNVVIGVIDTGFSNYSPKVLLEKIKKNEDHRRSKQSRDFAHGTLVSSLIIAHDELNPGSADELGNFLVKHFELLDKDGCAYEHAVKKIELIVSSNLDVKIWNISFGHLKSPYRRTIDSLGIIFDKIANTYDVLFIIAAGNDRKKSDLENFSLSTPGDSLNAITVGSVFYTNGKITRSDYSSFGPILHFEKPEISHFGGPTNKSGSRFFSYFEGFISGIEGTSFAAPRVARVAGHYLSLGYTPRQIKAKLTLLGVNESKKNKSSSYGWIDNKLSSIDLLDERILIRKNPLYIPINLPPKTKSVKVAAAHFVEPLTNLGEEYSIDNVEISLVWANNDVQEFERDNAKKTIEKNQSDKEVVFLTENTLRFEGGKYFNSKVISLSNEVINQFKDKSIKKLETDNLQLFIRVRKLSLYDIDNRGIKVGLVYSFEGDFEKKEFENLNSEIISIEQDIEVDV